jgi:hypothetical protein
MRLLEDLKERLFATLQERREYVEAIVCISVSRSTVCRDIARLGHTSITGASSHRARRVLEGGLEGDGGRRGGAREARLRGRVCSRHTSMAPIYGHAPKGERLPLSVPRKRGKNTTLLASMSLGGMGPTLALEGATTALVFEAYVERVLAPSLRKGQVVVMDNLGAHRPKRMRELIDERGCELLYLPAYSPDYNQIEETPLVPG